MNFEEHDAIVSSIDDEEQRGRIQVACAGLLGDEETILPYWIEPELDWGWFYVPDVGEIVEIKVIVGGYEDESFGQSGIDVPNPTWRGKRTWTSEETDGENIPRPIPEDFKTNYGKRRGFATPAGHILFFDDTEGKEVIEIRSKNGSKLTLDDENKKINLTDENGNIIDLTKDGVEITDVNSNIIRTSSAGVEVQSSGDVNITGGTANISTDKINLLDGASEAVPLGDSLKQWADTHTHPTGMGPSGVPIAPLPPAALSSNCKVGP